MLRPLLCLFFVVAILSGKAQLTLGLPEIVNYSKQVYKGGAQTRRMVQDSTGLLYFANDEGVLRFDGARWRSFPLPNRSLVRCLQFGPDGQLYVGGQDEVGYFEAAADGSLRYRSLKPLLPPKSRSFADVWEIYFSGRDLFFQTSTAIYHINGQKVSVFPDEHWRYMGYLNGSIIAQSKERGLLRFNGASWQPLLTAGRIKFPSDLTITAALSLGRDSALITTLKNGTYLVFDNTMIPWQTEALTSIAQQNISAACQVNEDQIAIGTSLNGCYIVDRKGNLVQHFSRNEGLQDNSLLGIFLDSRQNIWLGLHNGIDFIPYNNAISHLGKGLLKEGAGYSSMLFENQLYLGTSFGLFRVPAINEGAISTSRADVLPVFYSAGDAWNLSQVNNELFLSHNEGAFLVKNQLLQAIDKSIGHWAFRSHPDRPERVVAGSYKGISFFAKNGNSFIKEVKPWWSQPVLWFLLMEGSGSLTRIKGFMLFGKKRMAVLPTVNMTRHRGCTR